jgi:hypothetical protein
VKVRGEGKRDVLGMFPELERWEIYPES